MKLDLDRIGTELGQKAKIEENPPNPRRKKQAGLGKKAEKQNICSNGKKEEASWIGGKR
ncbi:MAG: hypothetical protein ACLUGQ_04710 [Coprococcus sp.]